MAENTSGRTFNVWTLGLLLGASCLVGGLFGYGLATMAVWGDGTPATLLQPALLAAVTWLVASAIGMSLILVLAGSDTGRLPMPVLASSVVRMLAALSLGLVLYFALKVDGRTFWASFLTCGLCCLMSETAWAMRTLSRLGSSAAGDSSHVVSSVTNGVSECS